MSSNHMLHQSQTEVNPAHMPRAERRTDPRITRRGWGHHVGSLTFAEFEELRKEIATAIRWGCRTHGVETAVRKSESVLAGTLESMHRKRLGRFDLIDGGR